MVYLSCLAGLAQLEPESTLFANAFITSIGPTAASQTYDLVAEAMAGGEEGRMASAAEAEQPADAAALRIREDDPAASSADEKSRYLLHTRAVDLFLSSEFSSTILLGGGGEMWAEANDSLNQLRKELAVCQAKLRHGYAAKGYVEVDDGYKDQVAWISKAYRDLDALVQKLRRNEEEESN